MVRKYRETGQVMHLAGSNDQDAHICLCSSTNHVGDVVFVTRRIQNCIPLLLGLKVCSANLNSLALCPLFLVGVHDVCHVPTFTILLLGFPAKRQAWLTHCRLNLCPGLVLIRQSCLCFVNLQSFWRAVRCKLSNSGGAAATSTRQKCMVLCNSPCSFE